MRLRFIILILTVVACLTSAEAQSVAVKTNLLYDATATLNGGVETRLAPQWTAEVGANLNAWDVNGHKWKHWAVQPGNLDMPFKLFGTDFRNLRDNRYQGWMGGLGIAYGYSWILSKHWNIEAEIGIGWVYTRYDRYECADCGQKMESGHPHNYVGPTKAAINLVYSF